VHFAVDTETGGDDHAPARARPPGSCRSTGATLGAGNPPNPDGHRTAYLWERVWRRDAWLDLLNRFVHVEPTPKGSKKQAPVTIFPRFHQWDAVLRLSAAARSNGAGDDYLVQHSAGSGKSNTIAWLAHRLSSLHNDADEKVFDKVVVITDRRVLDKQLQDTIYQFEHVHGVVQQDRRGLHPAGRSARRASRPASSSRRCRSSRSSPTRSTRCPTRTYAVIVDEAHSQPDRRRGHEAEGRCWASADGAAAPDELTDPVEDALAARSRPGVSSRTCRSFAFTATPKARTLELFGRMDPAPNRHVPFHLYSMRQAIEEGFILDVLANYVTYQTYWNIEKRIAGRPRVRPGQGTRGDRQVRDAARAQRWPRRPR
jgi:type I restriction enzyme R subunit